MKKLFPNLYICTRAMYIKRCALDNDDRVGKE